MAVNPMGLAAFVQQGFDQGTERREQKGLRALAGDYYSGKVTKDNARPFLGQVAQLGGNPAAYQQDMAGQEKTRQQRIGDMAAMLLSAPDGMRSQLYKSLVPELTALGFANPPPDYTPELDGIVRQIAQTHGRGGDGVKPMNIAPGGVAFDPASGREMYRNVNFAPQRPVYDAQRGGWAHPPGMSTQMEGKPFDAGGAFAGSGGFTQVAPPRPDYQAQHLDLARRSAERADEASRRADEASRRAARGTPPAGYRWNAEGTALEPIPGAPQSAGKPLPSPVVTKLTKQAGLYDNTTQLLDTFNDGYSGNVIGGGLENLAGRVGGERVGIATRGQADWWQQYDRQKNEVRNALFGSALTPTEQKAFEAADINPNMDPQRIRENLRMQQTLIARGLERQAKVWRAQGFNTEAIDAAVMPSIEGREPDQAAPPPRQQRATEGQTVINRQTGERMQLRNGNWQRIE